MTTNRRGLIFSGFGSWDAYSIGTLSKLDSNYDVVVGISTGCLPAPMIALKEWDFLKYEYSNIRTKDIYDYTWHGFFPISDNGKMRIIPIIRTLLLGKNSISSTNVLKKTIDKYFHEEYFNELNKTNKEILIGAQNYTQIPSKMHYFSSDIEKYEEFKDWMWCGGNIPLFGSFIRKGWRDSNGNFHIGYWNSGSLIDLSAIDVLASKNLKEIDIVLNRPKIEEKFEGNRIENLVDNVITSINAMNYILHSEYFDKKIKKLKKEGIKIRVFWLPRTLSPNPISYNRKQMISWWEEGYQNAFNLNNVDIYEPILNRF